MNNFELKPINSKISNLACIVLFMLALVVSIGAIANKIYKMNYADQPAVAPNTKLCNDNRSNTTNQPNKENKQIWILRRLN